MELTRRERILHCLKRRKSVTSAELADLLGVTRQAIHKHLRSMIIDGVVVKRGSTRSAVYLHSKKGAEPEATRSLTRTYQISSLAEDRAFDEMSQSIGLGRAMGSRAMKILRYAFTEILNNAINHSRSARCLVRLEIDSSECSFMIRDLGIGIYESVRSKFNLPDEQAALRELLKGKVTTMKERHSGVGIFFVSKAADLLRIRSHRTIITFDNRLHDTIVEQARMLRGTDVRFAISRRSRRDLNAVFLEYAPEEFDLQFQRTRVLVRLHIQEYISRSEAKRMLSGLEKFREVVLDFQRVTSIGQGFADEVFRVFPAQHPGTSMRAENALPAVDTMIRHVVGEAR